MKKRKSHFDYAEHCGWMIFTDQTLTYTGREADKRIRDLRELGFRFKKLYCKPGLIPDDGYVILLGETLCRLLELSPQDPLALSILSRLGSSRSIGISDTVTRAQTSCFWDLMQRKP
jgi:hypothetical protein